ncbi:hypothetical protein ABHF91_01290 [Pseudaeromonas sp. ZJS20]|uniref:tyrosine-type recombinase/integrase n=1 Tax=Pseudaeromonas aegiceratis TaxID=3153928 RepID=UPI00390C7A3D
MANPLILSPHRREATQQLGRQHRKAERQKQDEAVLRRALEIFGNLLPEMMKDPADTQRFDAQWPKIDQKLRHELRSETAYRRAYGFLCRQIERGNRSGYWSIATPTPYLTLRRQRPLRSLSWQHQAAEFAVIAEHWLSNLSPANSPAQHFARLLTGAVLFGGLARPELWPALGQALMRPRPLLGDGQYLWLPLQVDDSTTLASNIYIDEEDDKLPVSQIHYAPPPLVLALLQLFLRQRPAGWQAPSDVVSCLALINDELGCQLSASAFSRGAMAWMERQPDVALPQVLLEYAIGRVPSAALPHCYWQRLLRPARWPCQPSAFAEFQPLTLLSKTAQSSVHAGHSSQPYLLESLRELFKVDPNRPKPKRELIEELAGLQGSALTLAEQILVAWLHAHLAERDNAASTAQRYLQAAGGEWLGATLEVPLAELAGEELHELYQSILNRPRSQKAQHYLAERLEDLHRFAVQQFDLAPLPAPLAEGSKTRLHVSAAIVDEPLFAALLDEITHLSDLDWQQAQATQCFLILAYRTGLRPAELAKLRLKDVEPSAIGWLFVRESRHGHNKTEAALRKVPLFPLLLDTEHPIVSRHLGERRLLAQSASELLFHAPDNPFGQLDTTQLALMAKTLLGQLSGGLDYRLYHLRHSALSRLQLLLHQDLVPLPALVQPLLPYTAAQRHQLLQLIAGKDRLRDRYAALAAFAGHSSPGMSLSTYLHFTDLLLQCHLAQAQIPCSEAMAANLLGLRPHRIRRLKQDGDITPPRLEAYWRKRLSPYLAPLPAQPRAPQQQETNGPGIVRQSHYLPALAVLGRIQAGYDYRETAFFYQLSQELIDRWLATAQALRGLTTRKGLPRLFPKSRRHQLLPAQPVGIAERLDVARGLQACQLMRRDRQQLAELRWAIRYCLLNSNSSRAGIRFDNPATLQRFMAVVTQLCPWARWQLYLQYPKGKRIQAWDCQQRLWIERMVLKKAGPYPDGLGWLLLRHAEEEARVASGLQRYSSHALRILFHRLAIIFFSAEQVQTWASAGQDSAGDASA